MPPLAPLDPPVNSLSNGSSLFKRQPFILREVYFRGDSNTAPGPCIK